MPFWTKKAQQQPTLPALQPPVRKEERDASLINLADVAPSADNVVNEDKKEDLETFQDENVLEETSPEMPNEQPNITAKQGARTNPRMPELPKSNENNDNFIDYTDVESDDEVVALQKQLEYVKQQKLIALERKKREEEIARQQAQVAPAQPQLMFVDEKEMLKMIYYRILNIEAGLAMLVNKVGK